MARNEFELYKIMEKIG